MLKGTDSTTDLVRLDGGATAATVHVLRGRALGPQADAARSPEELLVEISQLRLRLRQQEHSLGRLADAVVALRRGGQALRDENRDLRMELEAQRRLRRHGRAGSI